MAYFPIFIDIEQKNILVAGGGNVALRKVRTLLRYHAHVKVVGKTICEEIRVLLPPEDIYEGSIKEADLRDSLFVIAATGCRSVNHDIAVFCHQNNIPVNVVDAPEECSFFFPAVVKKGDISVGVNTGAKSPVVSSHIRKKIEKTVPDYYADIVNQLGELREYVKEHFEEESDRRNILKMVAAVSFEKKRTLSWKEIETMIRQV